MGDCPAFEGWFHDNSALTPAASPEKAEKKLEKYSAKKNTELNKMKSVQKSK